MRAAASDENAADESSAAAARLARALVNAVFDLERTRISVGVDVIRYRGAAQANGVAKNVAESEAEAFELGVCKAAGAACGANAGAEEALVGINVAHAGKQRLIEKSCFDSQASAAEKSGEGLWRNLEGFGSRRDETLSAGKVAEFEAAEAAGIDEAQFESAGQSKPGMGVANDGRVGRLHQQLAGHAQVDDPLSMWSCG